MPEGITVENFMYQNGLVHNWVAVQISRAMEVHADELAGGSHTMGIEFHFSDVVTLMANGSRSQLLACGSGSTSTPLGWPRTCP